MSITVSGTRNQTMDGFGTCIAWWMNSPYDQDAWRNMYAQDMGCSILRVEIHPNVAVQAGYTLTTQPPINFTGVLADDIARLNFAAQGVQNAGQLAASVNQKKLDSLKLIGALWTPPHWMKTSSGPDSSYAKFAGPSGESCGGHLINDAATRTQFARYLAAYLKGFEQTYGVSFYAVSMQNEPAFVENYNSCVYYCNGRNGVIEYPAPFAAIGAELARQGITTKLMGPEDVGPGNNSDPWIGWNFMQYMVDIRNDATAYGYLKGEIIHAYGGNGVSSGGTGMIWNQYWNGRDSATYPSPAGCWWTGAGSDVQGTGRYTWMTETSGEAPGWLTTDPQTHNYTGAISIPVMMHEGFTDGQLGSWVYWQMADSSTNGEATSSTLTEGTNTAAKKYNAYKHFARYVRPGAVRLSVSPANSSGVYSTAFVHDVNNTLTVVITNSTTTAQSISLTLPGTPAITTFDKVYRTSSSENFAAQAAIAVSGNVASFTIPATSVMTLQGTGGSGPGQVLAPTFSPIPGSYSNSVAVTITSGTAGATIRYTTDGSTPSSTVGTLYSGPVTLNTTTTLKAIAYKSGMTDSTVTTGLYTVSPSTNVALTGSGYRWAKMKNATANTGKVAASQMNDNSTAVSIGLNNGASDSARAWEAGGVTWGTAQTLTKVEFVNGTCDTKGWFTANFRLQFSTDGTSWSDASGWTLSPSYPYGSGASDQTYTFTGNVANVKGVRVVGQVRTGGSGSYEARARELRAWN